MTGCHSNSETLSEDDQLMVRLQSGDVCAFDEIVTRYQGALIGFFIRNTRDVQFAEDLTQETLLRIYNQSWDYLPTGRFRGWIFRIARNLLIDNVRKRTHDALVRAVKGRSGDDERELMTTVAADLLPPEEIASQRETTEMIEDLLGRIPDDQRQTFVMHHFLGLTLSEVADAMESSLPTTKSRLRLAREKLRDLLQVRGITSIAGPD